MNHQNGEKIIYLLFSFPGGWKYEWALGENTWLVRVGMKTAGRHTSERNCVNRDDPCRHTIVFFFFFHRLYYSCLFFRKILTTKKPTITIKRAAILNLNANRGAGLSKAILWYVNVHLYVLNQIFLTVYIFFLSFFLFVFNLFIVLHF